MSYKYLKMYRCTAVEGDLRLWNKNDPAFRGHAKTVSEIAVLKSDEDKDEFSGFTPLFAKYANDQKNQMAVLFYSNENPLLKGVILVYERESARANNDIRAGGTYLFDTKAYQASPWLPDDVKTNPEGYVVGFVVYIDFDGETATRAKSDAE